MVKGQQPRLATALQAEHERSVVRCLAETCPGLIDLDQPIESCSPPKPDILCSCGDGSNLYIEVTEQVDAILKQQFDLVGRPELSLERAVAGLPAREMRAFEAHYDGTLISVHFAKWLSAKQRGAMCPGLIRLVLSRLPSPGTQVNELPVGVLSLAVSQKLDFAGASFSCPEAVWFAQPNVEKLEKKIRKAEDYEVDAPLGLLAYLRDQPRVREAYLRDVEDVMFPLLCHSRYDWFWLVRVLPAPELLIEWRRPE